MPETRTQFLLLSVFLAVCIGPQCGLSGEMRNRVGVATGNDIKEQFLYGGRTRTYLLHIPDSHRTETPMPLVVVLHGGGGNGENVADMSGMSRKADKENFIVAYPYGSGALKEHLLTWNSGNCCGYALEHNIDDVGFIGAMISRVEKKYLIDSSRIFATGMSNGGMMCYRLACELSDVFAAIAPVAGAFNNEPCEPKNPVSVMIVHGTADEHVPYDGGTGTKSTGRVPRVDRSVTFAATFWAEHNGCSSVSKKERQGTILTESYLNGRKGSEVVVITVNGGKHAWPGGTRGWIFGDKPTREISATDLMWDFFLHHPKK